MNEHGPALKGADDYLVRERDQSKSQGAMDGRQGLIHVLVAVGGRGRGRGGRRTGRSLQVAEVQAGIGDVAVGGEDRER